MYRSYSYVQALLHESPISYSRAKSLHSFDVTTTEGPVKFVKDFSVRHKRGEQRSAVGCQERPYLRKDAAQKRSQTENEQHHA